MVSVAVFQQLEIEEYSHDPPAIYLYGITDLGNTVFCQVEGFLPYFYVPAPIGFTVQHLEEMEQELKVTIINLSIDGQCLERTLYECYSVIILGRKRNTLGLSWH